MELMKFDRSNKQEDFLFMARNKDTGKLEIGYVAIHKPWYSPPSSWVYYIIQDKYKPNGFCGGSSDLGLHKIEVIKDTIQPYNQINKILYNKEIGIPTTLTNNIFDEKEVVSVIQINDEIPYELWNLSKPV